MIGSFLYSDPGRGRMTSPFGCSRAMTARTPPASSCRPALTEMLERTRATRRRHQ